MTLRNQVYHSRWYKNKTKNGGRGQGSGVRGQENRHVAATVVFIGSLGIWSGWRQSILAMFHADRSVLLWSEPRPMCGGQRPFLARRSHYSDAFPRREYGGRVTVRGSLDRRCLQERHTAADAGMCGNTDEPRRSLFIMLAQTRARRRYRFRSRAGFQLI
jgi:hypothetical protein